MADDQRPKEERPKFKGEKRRHHYTPVLYLKHFTDASGLLHAIYLPAGNRAATAHEALGFERDRYRPDFDEVDPNVYEDIFGEFEGEAAPVIREISETRALPTDEEELNILYNFIAFQSVRLPSTKRAIAAPIIHTFGIIGRSTVRRVCALAIATGWRRLNAYRPRSPHSPRRTTAGSRRAARSAGSSAAPMPVAASTAQAPAIASTSFGCNPNRSDST